MTRSVFAARAGTVENMRTSIVEARSLGNKCVITGNPPALRARTIKRPRREGTSALRIISRIAAPGGEFGGNPPRDFWSGRDASTPWEDRLRSSRYAQHDSGVFWNSELGGKTIDARYATPAAADALPLDRSCLHQCGLRCKDGRTIIKGTTDTASGAR